MEAGSGMGLSGREAHSVQGLDVLDVLLSAELHFNRELGAGASTAGASNERHGLQWDLPKYADATKVCLWMCKTKERVGVDDVIRCYTTEATLLLYHQSARAV